MGFAELIIRGGLALIAFLAMAVLAIVGAVREVVFLIRTRGCICSVKGTVNHLADEEQVKTGKYRTTTMYKPLIRYEWDGDFRHVYTSHRFSRDRIPAEGGEVDLLIDPQHPGTMILVRERRDAVWGAVGCTVVAGILILLGLLVIHTL